MFTSISLDRVLQESALSDRSDDRNCYVETRPGFEPADDNHDAMPYGMVGRLQGDSPDGPRVFVAHSHPTPGRIGRVSPHAIAGNMQGTLGVGDASLTSASQPGNPSDLWTFYAGRKRFQTIGQGNSRKSSRFDPGEEGDVANTYWRNGTPVIISYTGTKATVKTAKLPPIDAPNEIKQQCLQTFVNAIDALTEKHQEKLYIATAAFDELCSHVGMEAKLIAKDLDLAKGKILDNPTISLTKSKIVDDNLQPLDRPDRHDANVPQILHDKATYIEVQLTIKPKYCRTDIEGLDKNKLGGSKSIRVFIELRRVKDDMELSTAYTNDLLRARSSNKLTKLFNVCMHRDPDNNGDNSVNLLMKPESASGRNVLPSGAEFRKFAEDFVAGIKYAAIKQTFEHSYIGDKSGMLSVSQRLHEVKMRQWDPNDRSYHTLSVVAYQNKLGTTLKAVDIDNPPADMPSLPQVAYNGLTDALKARTYVHLPSNPGHLITDFARNVAALNTFMRKCREEETLLKQMEDTAVQMTTGTTTQNRPTRLTSLGRGGNRAYGGFLAYNQQQDPNRLLNNHTACVALSDRKDLVVPYYLVALASEGEIAAKERIKLFTHLATAEEECREELAADPELYNTFVSSAEEALRTASGMARPIECFGCGARGHTFRNCPRKDEPGMVEKFQKRWDEMLQKRRELRRARARNHYGPPQTSLATKTQNQGQTQNTMLTTATATRSTRDTSQRSSQNPPIRKTFMHYHELANQQQMNLQTHFARGSNNQLQFAINQQLAFLVMPISKNFDDRTELQGLYDTGGCCNIGWLPYHAKIQDDYPDLFASFTKLEDVKHENIKIGGIAAHILVTHIAVYYLPWKKGDGSHYIMEIGLSADLPLNTLFGLPFIIRYGLQPQWKQQMFVSDVLQEELIMKLERPIRAPVEDLLYKAGNMTKSFYHKEGKIVQLPENETPEALVQT